VLRVLVHLASVFSFHYDHLLHACARQADILDPSLMHLLNVALTSDRQHSL
jgi:hypothetical protein